MRRSLRILLLLILAAILAVNSVAYAEPETDGSGEDSGESEEPIKRGQTYYWDPFSHIFRLFDIPKEFFIILNHMNQIKIDEDSAVTAFSLELTSTEEAVLSLNEEKLAAATQALGGKIIGLDPGHQCNADIGLEYVAPGSELTKIRQSEGCFGVRSGVPEFRINLLVAQKVCVLLEKCGATVVMSRPDSDVSLSNIDRALMMNNSDAAMWIRIHCNASIDPEQDGACVLIPSESVTPDIYEYSLYLGECVSSTFVGTMNASDIQLVSLDNQTGFNWSEIPVIALEMGYLSNVTDDALLNSDAYQTRCAIGIFNGIVKYFIGIEPYNTSELLDSTAQSGKEDGTSNSGEQEPTDPVIGYGNGEE